jgi:hypothetical protein
MTASGEGFGLLVVMDLLHHVVPFGDLFCGSLLEPVQYIPAKKQHDTNDKHDNGGVLHVFLLKKVLKNELP